MRRCHDQQQLKTAKVPCLTCAITARQSEKVEDDIEGDDDSEDDDNRELKHATFLSHGRQPEVNLSLIHI